MEKDSANLSVSDTGATTQYSLAGRLLVPTQDSHTFREGDTVPGDAVPTSLCETEETFYQHAEGYDLSNGQHNMYLQHVGAQFGEQDDMGSQGNYKELVGDPNTSPQDISAWDTETYHAGDREFLREANDHRQQRDAPRPLNERDFGYNATPQQRPERYARSNQDNAGDSRSMRENQRGRQREPRPRYCTAMCYSFDYHYTGDIRHRTCYCISSADNNVYNDAAAGRDIAAWARWRGNTSRW